MLDKVNELSWRAKSECIICKNLDPEISIKGYMRTKVKVEEVLQQNNLNLGNCIIPKVTSGGRQVCNKVLPVKFILSNSQFARKISQEETRSK